MEVKDFMLFIGERVTGKSTVANWIFFFKEIIRKLKNDLFTLYNNDYSQIDPVQYFFAGVAQEFRYTFLSNSHSECTFYYSEDNQNFIQYKSGTFFIGDRFHHFLQKEFSEIQQLKVISESDKDTLSNVKADFFFKQLFKKVDNLYGNENVFFIPHNRAELVFKTGKEVYRNIINENFEALIRGAKKWLSVNQIAKENKFLDIQQKIIKGNLHVDSHGDIYISLSGNERVNLSNASSGQQESAAILMVLEFLFSEDYRSTAIIEEPESHLDPKAQSLMMEAIAAFANNKIEDKNNQVIITTHSPYILATVNNLMYAYQVAQSYPEEVKKIVSESLWLDPSRVGAYECKDGGIVDLIAPDGLIMNEELDRASIDINGVNNELFAIKNEATHEL
jgi:predicted ATPase